MHGLNHVHRRGAVYVWRRRLPKSLGSDRFLQVSLRTTNFFFANRLAALVNAIFVTSMREVKAQRISIAEARCLLEAEVAVALKLIEEERYYEPEATSQDEWRKRYFDEKCRTAALRIVAGRGRGACILDEDRRKLVEQGLTEGHLAQVQQEIDVLVQELGSAEFNDDLAAAVSDVTGRDGFSEPDLRYAAKVRMKARADAMVKADRLTCDGPLLDLDEELFLPRQADHIESTAAYPPAKPIRVDLFRGLEMEKVAGVNPATPAMSVQTGASEKPARLKPAVRKDGIEELKALYFKSLDRKPVGDEDPKTIAKDLRQRKSVLRHFSEAISTKHLADLMQSDLSDYVETMNAIPKVWGRNKEDRARTVHELIERAEELPPEEVGLAPATLNRNLGIIEAFLTFARAKRGVTPKAQLYFCDLRADTARGGSKKRLPFDLGDIEKLTSHPLWREGRCPSQDAKGGSFSSFGLYWCPIIASLSGVRREEIAGMRLSEVITDHDIPYFDVRPNQNRGLKNPSSKRIVPIHSALIQLGFFEYVETLRATGAKDLFPDLKPAKGGYFGGKLYKGWKPIIDEQLGSAGKGKTFHSWRHRFVSLLRSNADVAKDVVQDLVGHTANDVTDSTYLDRETPEFRDAMLARLNPALQSISAEHWFGQACSATR